MSTLVSGRGETQIKPKMSNAPRRVRCAVIARHRAFTWTGAFARAVARAFALCLALACAPASAHQADQIVERAWFEDDTGARSLAEIQRQDFQPFEGTLSAGFGSAPIWLRLRIAAPPPGHTDNNRLMLRIRPVYLDDIQVFDPLAPSGLAGVTGDRYPPAQAAFRSMDFLLPLPRGEAARDIWIRLESTSTRQIDVQALSLEDLSRVMSRQQVFFALYIGIIFLLAVWGVTAWLFTREALIGSFGLMQTLAVLFALGSLGYSRLFWPDAWPARWLDMATSLANIGAVAAAMVFHILLLRDLQPPAWLRRAQYALLALQITLLLAVPWLTRLALRINMTEILLVPMILLASAWASKPWTPASGTAQPPLTRPVLVAFYLGLVLVLGLAALPGLGLAGGDELPLYVVQSHGLLTALLILVVLQYRNHVIRRQQRETLSALERTELQAQQERSIREEQEKLMAMLAHELKTPLATMHMRLDSSAPGTRAIKQAISDMNAVIERCLQTARLGDRQLVPHLEPLDLAATLREVIAACPEPGRVQLITAQSPMTMRSDRQLLSIILNNLLENACKYAQKHTPIRVELGPAPDVQDGRGFLVLSVSNEPSPGAWPDPERLFEKYYRSPYARRQAGTGLGLFLVNNLLRALGGRIAYLPDARHVRFVLHLPANPGAVPGPGSEAVAAPDVPVDATRLRAASQTE